MITTLFVIQVILVLALFAQLLATRNVEGVIEQRRIVVTAELILANTFLILIAGLIL